MFGIGVPELLLILVVGLVVFGPGKLPEIGRSLGKTMNEFKKITSSISLDQPTKSRPAQQSSSQAATAAPAASSVTVDAKPVATEVVEAKTTEAASSSDAKS